MEKQNESEDMLAYYKQAYEREKQRNAELAGALADANAKAADFEFKLNRIKNNPFWKLSKPLRVVMHFCIRTKDRIIRYGNPKGVARKLHSKMIEKRAMRQHGTKSFPKQE